VAVYRVEAGDLPILYLLDSGRLTEDQASHRDAVARELA